MSSPDSTLIRCLRGQVGASHPEDGYLVKLPADVAAELIEQGEAVRVAAPGDMDLLGRLSLEPAAPHGSRKETRAFGKFGG